MSVERRGRGHWTRRLYGWRLGCGGRASGEGALEAAADVSMRLALGDAFGFVGPGFVAAVQSSNRHRVESTIEVRYVRSGGTGYRNPG
jgi:hypothetical protein